MVNFQQYIKYLNNPAKIIIALASRGLLPFISDKQYVSLLYKELMGKPLRLEPPETFNEKLQWLKLYDRNPNYSIMVDKIESKKYVANLIGNSHIIPTLGVWDDVDSIDFNSLPDQFVIKCSHDSASTCIVKDKSTEDLQSIKTKLKKHLKKNYYLAGREWPYKNVPHRIIAEMYMKNSMSDCNSSQKDELYDYKFFCFNGEVKLLKVDFDRSSTHKANYYDTSFSLVDCGEVVCPPDHSRIIEKPIKLDDMIQYATILSKGIPFLRVDFYNVDNNIYFGELTFFPASGWGPFIDEKWDRTLGSWLSLPL